MTASAAGARVRNVVLPPGWTLDRRGSVASTNDIARDLATRGRPHGTVVTADRQRSGRGRHGRAWSSPPGNLYASVLLRPAVDPADMAQLSLVAALALTEALAGFVTGSDVRVKWPNDVLVDGAKIAGLLLESAGAGGGAIDWVVVGSGVNIAHHPALSDRPTTSLAALGAREATPDDVLEAYLARLNILVGRWQADGFAAIRPFWLEWATGLGSMVRISLGDRLLSGRFADLDDAGAVILELSDRTRRTIAAGDLVLPNR